MIKDVGARTLLSDIPSGGSIMARRDYCELKTRSAIEAGLTAIVCVGEMLAERETGHAETVVKAVGRRARGLTVADMERIIIAYEPVWAIGTGKTATPEQAQEMHGHIRKILADTGGETSEMYQSLRWLG